MRGQLMDGTVFDRKDCPFENASRDLENWDVIETTVSLTVCRASFEVVGDLRHNTIVNYSIREPRPFRDFRNIPFGKDGFLKFFSIACQEIFRSKDGVLFFYMLFCHP